MKTRYFLLIAACLTLNTASSQSFLREIQYPFQQSAALVITMPDMGALYVTHSLSTGSMIALRYDRQGKKQWETDMSFPGKQITGISEMKLHQPKGMNPRILIAGSGSEPWFISLSETGNPTNPISVNFLYYFTKYSGYGINNFTILRNDEYMIPLSAGGVNRLEFQNLNVSGTRVTTLLADAYNCSGTYVYDLAEDPLKDNFIWFSGAVYLNGHHQSMLGAFNAGLTTANGLAPGAMKAIYADINYYDPTSGLHTNNGIDRIGFTKLSGKTAMLAIGHVNTIGTTGSRNLTLQVLDSVTLSVPAPAGIETKIISLGSSIGTGEDMGRFHLRPWNRTKNDSFLMLSGYGNSRPFIGIINPAKNGFTQIYSVKTDKISTQITHIPAYFDIADSGRIWIGSEYSASTDRNPFTGMLQLQNETSCVGKISPNIQTQYSGYNTLSLSNTYSDSSAASSSNFIVFSYVRSTSRTLCENGVTGGYVSVKPAETTADAIRLFPNPASDAVNLFIPGQFTPDYIRLIDINGKVLAQFDGDTRHISVNQLPPGIYLIQAANSRSILSARLIRQ